MPLIVTLYAPPITQDGTLVLFLSGTFAECGQTPLCLSLSLSLSLSLACVCVLVIVAF